MSDLTSAILIASQIISPISITSGLLVIFIYWYFKEIRMFVYELIVYLCISHIIININYLIPSKDNSLLSPDTAKTIKCVQTFISGAFHCFSWLFAMLILYSLYLLVIKKTFFETNSKSYRIGFLIVTAIISIAIGTL